MIETALSLTSANTEIFALPPYLAALTMASRAALVCRCQVGIQLTIPDHDHFNNRRSFVFHQRRPLPEAVPQNCSRKGWPSAR